MLGPSLNWLAWVSFSHAQEPTPTAITVTPPLLRVSTPKDDPQAPTGDVYLDSTHRGAVVVLDGNEVDSEPPTLLGGLAPGPHHLMLKTKCTRAQAQVDVRANEVTRVQLPLVEGVARLRVESNPRGAEVYVDEALVGLTPLRADLDCGTHSIELQKDGYHPQVRSLEARGYESSFLAFELEPLSYGTLVVVPSPVEARILLDGEDQGEGPHTFDGLLSAKHEIGVQLDGYAVQTRTVEVKPNVTTRVEVALDPVPVRPPPVESRRSPERVALTLLSGASSGVMLGVGAVQYHKARDAYGDYLLIDGTQQAESFMRTEVRPHQGASFMAFGAGAGLAVVTGMLWRNDHRVAAGVTPTSATLSTSW